MSADWRCEICNKNLDRLNRGRARRGERLLTRRAVTCSPACSTRRKQTLAWQSRWRCRACGVDKETANARRARRGLRAVARGAAFCSSRCKAAVKEKERAALLRGARTRMPPLHRGLRNKWVCSECGVDVDGAMRKRRRLGLRAHVELGQRICTPTCRKAFVARLSRWVFARRAKRRAAAARRRRSR